MTVQELKELFGVSSNKDIAKRLEVGSTAVSNWVANGVVPPRMELKAKSLITATDLPQLRQTEITPQMKRLAALGELIDDFTTDDICALYACVSDIRKNRITATGEISPHPIRSNG